MEEVNTKNKKTKQQGQSVIEFILVTSIILVMIFAFLQLAWATAWGHYVHYATFMASRAYFAAHENRQEQTSAAAYTLRSLLKKKDTEQDLLSFIARSRTGSNRDIGNGVEPVSGAFIGTHPYAASSDMSHRAFSWAEGVQYNFEFRLFTLPLAKLFIKDEGQVKVGEKNSPTYISWNGKVGLASDSWLGRETTIEECQEFLRNLSANATINGEFLFDNGC